MYWSLNIELFGICIIILTVIWTPLLRRIWKTSKPSWKNVKHLLNLDKDNAEALSQLYKMMNYKPTNNKGEKLTTEQVANFLKVNKKKEGDVYDDIMYYDDAKIKELVLRQTFLIAKGYFDPK